jgi:outer membrane lipoprotein LolB
VSLAGVTIGHRVWAGRFAIEGEPDLPAASGRFALERHDQSSRLDLLGPLGQVLARLEIRADGASLTRADGRVDVAGDANQLIEDALGWRLPVNQMARWLDGDFAQVIERAADGSARSAIDTQWKIRIDPPRRWSLEWPADSATSPSLLPGRRVRLRLLLDP